jgi:hypothetical protein
MKWFVAVLALTGGCFVLAVGDKDVSQQILAKIKSHF